MKRMITNYCISLAPMIYIMNWLIICLALIAWLPAPAKEAKGMPSSDSAASVGSSSETVFRTASSISSFSSSSELGPERSH